MTIWMFMVLCCMIFHYATECMMPTPALPCASFGESGKHLAYGGMVLSAYLLYAFSYDPFPNTESLSALVSLSVTSSLDSLSCNRHAAFRRSQV